MVMWTHFAANQINCFSILPAHTATNRTDQHHHLMIIETLKVYMRLAIPQSAPLLAALKQNSCF